MQAGGGETDAGGRVELELGGKASELLPEVYRHLREIAAQRISTLSANASIQPTELLHEAYARLVKQKDAPFVTQRHFIAAAALAMRSVLVDRARAKASAKRGGKRVRVPLTEVPGVESRGDEEVLELDELLRKLEAVEARSARVVSYRVFLGMTTAEVAHALGVTERTVRRDWAFAKAWLARELAGNVSRE